MILPLLPTQKWNEFFEDQFVSMDKQISLSDNV